MNTIQYSVIIPAFNTEKTLRRCLDSLLRQNRADVQILVISDGSTDGTDAIARSFGQRIEFIPRPHGGVSTARNWGLALAKGEYVTFVDSDDFVLPDYFAALDREPDCDVLVFGVSEPAGKDPIRSLLTSRKLMPPWNKRIRRSLIEENRLRFPEGLQIGEDFCFCFACALAAKTIHVSAADIYCVDISNENSLSRGYRTDLEKSMVRAYRYVAGLNGAEAYGKILDFLFVTHVFTCIAEEYKQAPPTRQRVCRICDSFRPAISKPSGAVHRGIRLLLKLRWDDPLWLAAYLWKGRKFAKCGKRRS